MMQIIAGFLFLYHEAKLLVCSCFFDGRKSQTPATTLLNRSTLIKNFSFQEMFKSQLLPFK